MSFVSIAIAFAVGGVAGYLLRSLFGQADPDDVLFLERAYEAECEACDEATAAHGRAADALSVAHGKLADIRELIDGTTRVRSSRIADILG